MTIIAWDGKTLAADKRAIYGSNKCGKVTKIFRWEGGLCGASGSMEQGMQLVSWLQKGADPEEFPEFEEKENEFLVVHNDGRVAYYESTPTPLWFENDFQAIGSGKEYALAAMYMGQDAAKAVEVACALDAYCGNGIDTLDLQCV